MKSRNEIVARFGLSALLSSGLLLAPAVAWSDDASVDGAEDAVADASLDIPADLAADSSSSDAAILVDGGGDGGARTDGAVADGAITDGGGSDGARAGTGGGGGAGGAAGAVVIPEDDAGCSTAGPRGGTSTGLFALLATAAAFLGGLAWRRRRARR